MVFLQVGATDRVLQALAPRLDGADGDFATGGLNGAARLFEERPVPALRFEAPRPHEDAAFDHHGPDADEAVRLGAGPQADDLAVADGGQYVAGKTSFRFHIQNANVALEAPPIIAIAAPAEDISGLSFGLFSKSELFKNNIEYLHHLFGFRAFRLRWVIIHVCSVSHIGVCLYDK